MARNERNRGGTIVFLEVLRGLAAMLVVYDHLVGQWLDEHRVFLRPAASIERYIEGPFVITQHFGWLGVALFFLISGFIISHVASSETHFEFATKRVLRIYPPLIVAVLVAVGDMAFRHATNVHYIPGQVLPPIPGLGDILASMTLVNYVMVPQPVVLGVGWSLIIEVTFYLFMFATLPLLRRVPIAVPCLLILFVVVCLQTQRAHGPSWQLFSIAVSYLPLLGLGQLLWLFWSGRANILVVAALSIVTWAVWIRFLEQVYPQFLRPDASYGPSLLAGYALFAGGLALEGRLQRRRVWRWLAERSYSLYLLHGTIGILALDLTFKVAAVWIAIPVGIGVSLATAAISYAYVERPSQRLARTICARRAQRTTLRQAGASAR